MTSVESGKEGVQSQLLARDDQEAKREMVRVQEMFLEWETAGEIAMPSRTGF